MDYTQAFGTKLYKHQWDQMRYPEIVVGLFEDDAEGAMQSNDENEIVKKLLSVEGNGFLLCKKCEEEGKELNPEKNLRYKISLNGKFFNCIIGKINADNLELAYDIQTRDELSIQQNPISSNLSPLHDQFLLIRKSDGSIVPCESTSNLPSIFCSLQELSMTDALESEILKDISQCIDQSDFSGPGVLQYASEEAISYEAIKNGIAEQLKKEFFTNVKIGVRLHDQHGNSEFISTTGVEEGNQELTLLIKVDEANNLVYIKNINVSADYLNVFISKLQNDANRRGIKVNVEELRQQVISDIETEETNKSFADHAFQSLSAFFNEGVGKYVEVVQTTHKAAKNIWDEGKMAQSHWYYPHQDHNKWPEYGKMDEMAAGPLDAVIDEVTGIPMACKSMYGVMTDAKQREAFGQLFTSEGMNGLIQSLKDEAKSTLNDEEKLKYSSSKTVVSVAAMFLTGGISKAGKGISMLENLMSSMGQLAKYKKLTSYLENIKQTFRYQPEVFAKVKKQFDEVFEKFKDLDGGEIVQRLDNMISMIGVEKFNLFLEKLHRLKNIPGIEKILLDLSIDPATGWKKFVGSKFVVDYVSKKGDDFISKINNFELGNEILIDGATKARVYDMVADGVRYEFKNWNGFYPSTIKTQFIRDLTNPVVSNIDQIKWVFNKTDNISDLGTLKGKVLSALKKVDGSPIDELSQLPLDKVKQLLGNDFGVITEANKAQKLLSALGKDEFFDVIFEVAD